MNLCLKRNYSLGWIWQEKHAMEGKIRNADNVISDMREKYEL